ncbi:MAG: hypothetical protein AB1394_15035, partial [Bacteroidota bacterium]
MKKLIMLLFSLLVYSNLVFAQSYSVWFVSPSSGSTVANVYNSEKVAVNVSCNATGAKHRYHSKWKFILKTNVGNFTTHDSPWFSAVHTPSGNFTWTIEMWEVLILGDEYKRAEASVNINVKFVIYAENNFGSGNISLEGVNVSSGSSTNKIVGDNVAVGAIEQSDGTYWRVWNTSGTNNSNWKKNNIDIYGATSIGLSYTVGSNDNGVRLTADMKKLYSLTFQNSYSSMYVNGSTYALSATVGVVEQNSITAYGNTYVNNGIEY